MTKSIEQLGDELREKLAETRRAIPGSKSERLYGECLALVSNFHAAKNEQSRYMGGIARTMTIRRWS